MAKYQVIRAWQGVTVGDIIETSNLHPAIKSNVRRIDDEPTKAQLTPATPDAISAKRKPKADSKK